jgi:hypothetical protein
MVARWKYPAVLAKPRFQLGPTAADVAFLVAGGSRRVDGLGQTAEAGLDLPDRFHNGQNINLQGRYEFQKAPDTLNVDAIIREMIGLPSNPAAVLVA